MTTTTTTIFNDSLDVTNGSRSDSFKNADYAVIIAPLIENVGDDFQVDTFLQLEFGNRNRLVPLQPINALDTNNISIVPLPFKAGNELNLYLFMVASEPINVEVIIVSSEDDRLISIEEKIDELTVNNNNQSQSNDIINSVIDIIRLSGGDVSRLLPLVDDVISGLDSFNGVELPALPQNVDTITELQNLY